MGQGGNGVGIPETSTLALICHWHLLYLFHNYAFLLSDRDDFSASVRQLSTTYTPLTSEQESHCQTLKMREELYEKLKDCAKNSCFVQMYECRPFPTTTKSKQKCPPSLVEVGKNLTSPSERDFLKKIQLDRKELEDLASATIEQSESTCWYDQRRGRITASIFGRVNSRVKASVVQDEPQKDLQLVRLIMGYDKIPNSAPLKHGQTMEPHA